jgi:hypothetical protein
MMRVVDFVLLPVKLSLYYREVTLELLVEAPQTRVLEGNQLIHMD